MTNQQKATASDAMREALIVKIRKDLACTRTYTMLEWKVIEVALSASNREAFYTILNKYIPQQSIDQAWQELREAGLVP